MLKQFVLAFLLVSLAISACEVNPNTMPLIDQEPELLAKVENGEKYLITDDALPHNFVYIARVKGTAYEMGKAFGQLFK